MALKAILPSLDGIEAVTKALYKEHDGKYILDVEEVDGYALEDVGGIKIVLSKERGLTKEHEKALSKFKGIDPDAARSAISELEELKKLDPTKDMDKIVASKVDAAKGQLVTRHAAEIAQRDTRIGALTKAVEGLLVDQAATAALAESKGSVALLLPIIRSQTRVSEKDGQFSVEIVDRDGNPRIADAKGNMMDIKGLIAEMRQTEAYSPAFEAVSKSGTGMVPGIGIGGGAAKTRNTMNTKEKADYIGKHGQAEYLKLPAK